MRKRLIVLLFIVALMLTACGQSGSNQETIGQAAEAEEKVTNQETFTIKLGHVLAPNHPYHLGSEKFKEIVEAESNGRLQVSIYHSGQLGGESQLVNSLQSNTVQMAIIGGTMGVVEPKFFIIDLPYAFKSKEHAYELLDGELGDKLFSLIPDKKLKGLAYWENGFRHITNSARPIQTPDDLKGIKLRVPENKVSMEIFRALQANPTPIASPEVFSALEQKIVDGQENPIANIYASKYQEVQKYLSLTGHQYGAAPLVMSLDFYNSLPEDLQKIVEDAAVKARDYERQVMSENESNYLEEIKAAGVMVNEVDTTPFREQTKSVYSEFESVIGKELLDLLLK